MYIMYKDQLVLYINRENGNPQSVNILPYDFLPYRLRGVITSQEQIDNEIKQKALSPEF